MVAAETFNNMKDLNESIMTRNMMISPAPNRFPLQIERTNEKQLFLLEMLTIIIGYLCDL